jgi:hypothetical protein
VMVGLDGVVSTTLLEVCDESANGVGHLG